MKEFGIHVISVIMKQHIHTYIHTHIHAGDAVQVQFRETTGRIIQTRPVGKDPLWPAYS
jgi:hypothetical protein